MTDKSGTWNSAEHIDRLRSANFRTYLLDNPFYCEDVLGVPATEEAIDAYIEQNRHLFSDEKKKRAERRRL